MRNNRIATSVAILAAACASGPGQTQTDAPTQRAITVLRQGTPTDVNAALMSAFEAEGLRTFLSEATPRQVVGTASGAQWHARITGRTEATPEGVLITFRGRYTRLPTPGFGIPPLTDDVTSSCDGRCGSLWVRMKRLAAAVSDRD